ncbi:MAG: hypothetical protein FJ078_07175 [Cyanobacteria bacterium K_DeepCast_35m_m2_155]|nr:hypothetical protein [Cyanobacteria bacterium K_DeepCast_35m_m2_155]
MATASSKAQPRPVSLWRRPLLVGVCFGLGYGLTQRLLDLQLPALVQWGQSFDVREFPGTSLESLRLRFGSENQELRGRLDLLELEAEQPKPADPLALPEDQLRGDQLGLVAPEPPAAPAAKPPAPSLPPPPASMPSEP